VRALLERFEAQTAALTPLVEGLAPEVLDRAHTAQAGSIRRWVHHLADASLVGAQRVRAVIAEPGAFLPACDFGAWSERLGHDQRPLETSLALYRAARAATLEVLRAIPPETWEARGRHEKLGALTLRALVEQQVEDADGHLADIRRAR
jgi:hypothetical protein